MCRQGNGRPRLFEAKQKIRDYEIAHHTRIEYVTAPPRMAEYIRVSSKIYEIYRKYVCKDDIHVYSIDECFIDVTGYLHFYEKDARAADVSPAHQMAITMIRDVLAETGITATVGIGTNLYLAKVGMDIVAKKAKPDKDGVRIAELDEDSYKILLWDHKPLTLSSCGQLDAGMCGSMWRDGHLIDECRLIPCMSPIVMLVCRPVSRPAHPSTAFLAGQKQCIDMHFVH